MRYPAFSPARLPAPRTAIVPVGAAAGFAANLPHGQVLARALPHPARLAALGTVLCQYRPALGDEAAGWRHAQRVSAQVCMDSDGLRESLWFFDRHGQCSWRLHLLPDSDFLAWDRLLTGMPTQPAEAPAAVGERLWHRLASLVRSGAWRMQPVSLHAIDEPGLQLVARPAPLSAVGQALARRLAHAEGAELG